MYTYVYPGMHVKFNQQRLWRLVGDVETEGFVQTVKCTVTTGLPGAFKVKAETHVYDVRFDCLTVKIKS